MLQPPGGSRRAPAPRRATLADRVLRLLRVDFVTPHRPPRPMLVAVAAAFSIAASLGLDALAVHLGESLYPATRHFSHFRVGDYATLTVVGVVVACAAWPVVTRVSSAPRWLFLRMAVAVTVALWLPDGWLLLRGESPQGVAVLMVMHLLIALVTYNALVRIAPARLPRSEAAAVEATSDPAVPRQLSERNVRRVWNAMAILVSVELVVGVGTIVVVPFKRTDAFVPPHGTAIYVLHGALGVLLGAGAVAVLVVSSAAGRLPRIGAVMGAVGVGIGLVGGLIAGFGATRLLGMGLMLVGTIVAGIGYLTPALEAFGKAEAARAGVPPGLDRRPTDTLHVDGSHAGTTSDARSPDGTSADRWGERRLD